VGPCEQTACDDQGACAVGPVADGAACDDGDRCTTVDTCQAGACQGASPVECPAPAACHLPGACQPGIGACTNPAEADGSPCDDGLPETLDDACRAGVCVGGSQLVPCPDPPACDAAPPDPGPEADWRHGTSALLALGTAYHRGRDLFLAEGDPQWALAKFAYGLLTDSDLHDEDVDLWLLRDCETWEHLGTATTSEDDDNPTVEGVADTGGRVFFRIPEEKRLGIGRHRIHFVVKGDLSTADASLTILPPGARVVVTDIDGTLTTSEYAQAWDTLLSISPEAHPGAADAFWALARKGYHIFYLTARPEFLEGRTQEWLVERGFPPGVSHTTLNHLGASGAAAIEYKVAELALLTAKLGYPPDYGFGNKDTDAAAYVQSGVPPARCYYYDMTDDPQGGVVHSDYAALVPVFEALDSLCTEPIP